MVDSRHVEFESYDLSRGKLGYIGCCGVSHGSLHCGVGGCDLSNNNSTLLNASSNVSLRLPSDMHARTLTPHVNRRGGDVA